MSEEQIKIWIAFDYPHNKFTALVIAKGKKIDLGKFGTKQEAVTACDVVKAGLLGGVK